MRSFTKGWHKLFGNWTPSFPKPPVSPADERPVIGLALGGGFARGLAHLGVLKVLEENNVRIDMIAGVSVGALIGGAYASGLGVKEMEEQAGSVRFRDFASWTVSRLGLASNARMEQFLRKVIRVTAFEELSIPAAVIATDISTGEPVAYRSGDLLAPIRASCAYPGLFLPVRIGNRTLIDGGFSCAVPTVALAQMGATHIIAVHLICNPFPSAIPTNIFQMVAQCFNLLQRRAGSEWRRVARSIIEPPVAGFAWDEFARARELIAAGEQATRSALPRLLPWMQPKLAAELAYSR